ncbi:GNAT family N-acetyltransferase [Streptomyces sp. NPDC050560]|uniref:GNAT family N-acetyltransferase n=1 Tax=Streptomyces sp. NPDC050560 TaxID=3365630 RepID=UPI00378FC57F
MSLQPPPGHPAPSAAHPADLSIDRATPGDWAVITGWAADEGWNPGLTDATAFFAQDPDGFLIGRIDGSPVSAISLVHYGDDYAFLGHYLVRPDLRGRGLGIATWKAAIARAKDRTIGLDGVVAQQHNYRRSGFSPAHRTHRYTGPAPRYVPTPEGVVPAATVDRDTLLAYDGACWPADRPRFLDQWLTAPGHRALARLDGTTLTGFGVIRPARDSYRVGPLFADTPDDARALLDGLTAGTGRSGIALDVPDSHPEATALATGLGLTPTFETARMYTGPVRPVAEDRVYAVTTLELG